MARFVDKEEFIRVYNDIDQNPSIQDVADSFDVSYRSVSDYAKILRDNGEFLVSRRSIKKAESVTVSSNPDTQYPDLLPVQLENTKLKRKISQLNLDIKKAYNEVTTSSQMTKLIHGLNDIEFDVVADFLTETNDSDTLMGIPVLMISDIHFDEVVSKLSLGGVNEYNNEIAVERIRTTFRKAKKMLVDNMANPEYDGIVLSLNGDLLSGNIHDELAETNEKPILQSVIDLTDILISEIQILNDEFGKVFIPCTVGNHGRLHKKYRHKNKASDNYEYLIYHYIAKHFSSNDDITVHIPSSPDAIFSVYNTTFCQTHGDSFKGGNGIAGILTPLFMNNFKKGKNYQSIGKPYDVLLVGHFHQLIMTERLIVNGSIKGWDEYAANNNFSYEPPRQALFVVHPTDGITYRMPVLCDEISISDEVAGIVVF